jgi:hypothetical protein
MPQVKRAAKGKRPNKAVSVLGIAGVSLAASTGGSPADIPPASLASPPAGSVADILWQNTAPFQIPFLDEEEISDVSLATFHLFDKDDLGSSQSGIQVAFGGCGGGCGCGHGLAEVAFEAAEAAFEAAEAAALAAAAAGAGAGSAAAACHGEAAPSVEMGADRRADLSVRTAIPMHNESVVKWGRIIGGASDCSRRVEG